MQAVFDRPRPKASMIPSAEPIIGLKFRIFPTRDFAFPILPPFSRYSSVSKAVKT